jgi:hypothetical protein
MTAVATGEAATLREPEAGRRVYRRHEFPELLDAALLDDGDGLGTMHIVYAEDVTVALPRGRSARSVLVVTVNRGWGAGYFRDPDKWAWITHNPQSTAEPPDLLFDPEAGTDFPSSAAIPVGQLRRAIEQFLQTGQRPTRVEWREAEQYMIY